MRETRGPALEILKDRQTSYAFFARLFRQEVTRPLLSELLNNQAWINSPDSAGPGQLTLRNFFLSIQGKELDQIVTALAAEYASLFLSVGRKPVFPYESVYTSPEHLMMQQARDEVRQEYLREGLNRVESFKEPEDHIALELEFMGYLCQKASDAIAQEDWAVGRAYLTHQQRFLDQHLLNWVPQFCEDTLNAAASDFYKGIAQWMRDFLMVEKETQADLMESIESQA